MIPRTAPLPKPVVVALTVVASLAMLVPGGWAWIAPASFADAANWPHHEHFLHDAGVFQIAIGLALLAALRWRDALLVTLGGFLLANTLHAVNHVTDLRLGGGSAWDPILLGGVCVLAAIGLVLRVWQLRVRHAERAGAS